MKEINTAIQQGHLRNLGGELVKHPIEGGLVRAASDILYPILDGIPILVSYEGIPIAQFQNTAPHNQQ